MRLKCLLHVMIITFLLGAVTGCHKEEEEFTYSGVDSGTTCANVLMTGQGFASNGDFIYFHYYNKIYEYNLKTGKTVIIDVGADIPDCLFVSGEYICYAEMNSNALRYISKDGKSKAIIFERNSIMFEIYAEGMNLYFSSDGNLYSRNMENGQETIILSSIRNWFLDKNEIYACMQEGDRFYLLCGDRQGLCYEKHELSFKPIALYVDSGRALMSKSDKIGESEWAYPVVLYERGRERQLPVSSTFYQVHDNHLIYLDSSEFNGSFPLKTYNLETGEYKTLSDNVMHFAVLEQRYICFQKEAADGREFLYYDWQTGEMVLMYKVPIN